MRNFIIFLLVLSIITVPVSASGFDQSNLMDIMPYLQEDKNQNISDNSVSYNFYFDGKTTITYVDFLIYSNVSSLSAKSNNKSLTVVNVGDRFWRIYGNVGGLRKSDIDLALTTSGGAYVELVSARMFQSSVDIFDIEAYCQINTDSYDSTIHYVPTDTINGRGWESDSTIENTFVQCFIWTEEWRKYDYIEIQLMLDIASISSISGMLGNDNFDVDVSHIYSERWDSNYYYVNLGFDVSQFLRSSDQDPTIYLFGNLKYDLGNSITFSSCTGHVYRESSADLTGILNGIKSSITDLKTSLTSALSSLNMSITAAVNATTSAVQNVEVSLSTGFSSLLSSINGNFVSLDGWIKNQTTSILSAFSSLSSKLDANFANLSSWLTAQTNSLLSAFSSLNAKLDNKFTELNNNIDAKFSSLNTWIKNQTKSIVDAINGDTAPGEQFQDDLDDRIDDMDDIGAIMESVPEPDFDSVDFNPAIDMSSLSHFSDDTFGYLMTSSVFAPVFVMAFILAILSYVLYGKR